MVRFSTSIMAGSNERDYTRCGACTKLKGVIMAAFGVGVLGQVVWKLIHSVRPTVEVMAAVGLLAFAANLVCLVLLWRRRTDDINMRSAFICSRNDVVGNAAVLLAAGGVALTRSPWPDVVVGLLVAGLFVRSALHVIADASRTGAVSR